MVAALFVTDWSFGYLVTSGVERCGGLSPSRSARRRRYPSPVSEAVASAYYDRFKAPQYLQLCGKTGRDITDRLYIRSKLDAKTRKATVGMDIKISATGNPYSSEAIRVHIADATKRV